MKTTPPMKHKRSYWIDSKVQWAIIQKTLLLCTAVIALLYLADQFFFYRMESMGKELGFEPDHVYFMFLKEQQRIKFWTFLATAGIISVVGTFIGIRFSHRIAGPIFRLKKELRRINNGEKIQEVNLRNADFFMEMAEEFNAMTLKLGVRKMKDAESDASKSSETEVA